MVGIEFIVKVFDDVIDKCGRNRIPSTSNNYVRFNKDVREKFDEFIDEYCGDNPSDVEHVWVVNDRGSVNFMKTGQIDNVGFRDDELSFLEEFPDKSLNVIHNHPHANGEGYVNKMPECLSVEDVLYVMNQDWAKSITAVNGSNGSKMIIMKSKDFVSDFEIDASVTVQLMKLHDAYFKYMDDWEAETRQVWKNDEKEGNKIANDFMKSLPKGTRGVVPLVHENYENIARENLGSFEDSIKDIRDALNKYGLDISIEME